jgi:hypothetical protein
MVTISGELSGKYVLASKKAKVYDIVKKQAV